MVRISHYEHLFDALFTMADETSGMRAAPIAQAAMPHLEALNEVIVAQAEALYTQGKAVVKLQEALKAFFCANQHHPFTFGYVSGFPATCTCHIGLAKSAMAASLTTLGGD